MAAAAAAAAASLIFLAAVEPARPSSSPPWSHASSVSFPLQGVRLSGSCGSHSSSRPPAISPPSLGHRMRCFCTKTSSLEVIEADYVLAEDENVITKDSDDANRGTYIFCSPDEKIALHPHGRKYIIFQNTSELVYTFNYILGGTLHGFMPTKEDFLLVFRDRISVGFDPDNDFVLIRCPSELPSYIGGLFLKVMVEKYGSENFKKHFISENNLDKIIDLEQIASKTSIIVIPFSENGSHYMVGTETKGNSSKMLGRGFRVCLFRYDVVKERILDDQIVMLMSGRIFHGLLYMASFAQVWRKQKSDCGSPNMFEVANDLCNSLRFLDLECVVALVDTTKHGQMSIVQVIPSGEQFGATAVGDRVFVTGTGGETMMQLISITLRDGTLINEVTAGKLVHDALVEAHKKDPNSGGYIRIYNSRTKVLLIEWLEKDIAPLSWKVPDVLIKV